jgi:hypothetical protein
MTSSEVFSEKIPMKRCFVSCIGLPNRIGFRSWTNDAVSRVGVAQQCVGKQAEYTTGWQMVARRIRNLRQHDEFRPCLTSV